MLHTPETATAAEAQSELLTHNEKKEKEKKEPDYFEAVNLESGFSFCPAVKMLTTVDREVGVTSMWS